MTWLVIGISGATCSGKTTLAKKLHAELKNSVLINQDAYFLPEDDPRHVHVAELNHHNWDILESLDMTKMYADVLKILSSKDKQKDTARVLIMDGFLLFSYKPISDLCDLKYFLDLTREECERRRVTRAYDPPDVPGYFEKVVWPEYVKYKRQIESDKKLFGEISFLDGIKSKDETFQCVFHEISEKL